MSLTDIVSHAGYAMYAEIALILFFVAFVGVVIYVFVAGSNRWERARRLPLADDSASGGAQPMAESSGGESR